MGTRGLWVSAAGWKGRDLVKLSDFSTEDVKDILNLSAALKKHLRKRAVPEFAPLAGESLSMIFQKRSTRTRVSTETGMAKLGGQALFLSSEDIQLGTNEALCDTARVLSRFNSCILARVFEHSTIEELAAESSVPIINGLSDSYHPLQALADALTMQEHCGGSLEGKRLSWVGDGNNIIHSLLAVAPRLGMHVSVATPAGYECAEEPLRQGAEYATAAGTELLLTTDPLKAVAGSDFIATDTWVSMGQEDEKASRLAAFSGYQVTEAMAAEGGASNDWAFLHCLPRKPEEVDDAVFYSDRSLVWDEAENRMWTVMAVMLAQLRGGADIPGM
ncbi:hypothetical protein FNF29_08296 [Cafeteria roenbergensis]|uniref:ornithine carbamoyltransferase n=1 Tax=Cafeteria roenbergensis TaxID=33653 RepID=A0A5A8BZE9_CAFRO|nr:hypothetical protein FNF29_08296 [Cafeteria roenbergensis]KAA0147631.1 hypothetical protein FNF28_07543 [Cafeteria roenbergensis]|eukprot:KAA0146028.1 hypothetical protein FNF29_08296 [Cafeteria roenbergensis]